MSVVEAIGSRDDDAAPGVNESRTPVAAKASAGGERAVPLGPAEAAAAPHLGCPYCCGYEVDRLYVGSAGVDSCMCRACGADWDEVKGSGEVKGRSRRHSALLHH